ncbi:MAG: hypothetical protein BIFFINMI_02647 [Phycisphaerae bacterium]|nr:hypothetical protein [Phycisphaerae bacterium]
MKRLLIWASPVLGIIVGMAAILVLRHQSSADAEYVAPAAKVQLKDAKTNKNSSDPAADLAPRPFVLPTVEDGLRAHAPGPLDRVDPAIDTRLVPGASVTTPDDLVVIPDLDG